MKEIEEIYKILDCYAHIKSPYFNVNFINELYDLLRRDLIMEIVLIENILSN